jgi:hypothetical protein
MNLKDKIKEWHRLQEETDAAWDDFYDDLKKIAIAIGGNMGGCRIDYMSIEGYSDNSVDVLLGTNSFGGDSTVVSIPWDCLADKNPLKKAEEAKRKAEEAKATEQTRLTQKWAKEKEKRERREWARLYKKFGHLPVPAKD